MSFLKEENYRSNGGFSGSNGTTGGYIGHTDDFDNYLDGKDATLFKVSTWVQIKAYIV